MSKQKRFNRDGLPIDARDWLEADWADLHHALEKVKRQVAGRHAQDTTHNHDTDRAERQRATKGFAEPGR